MTAAGPPFDKANDPHPPAGLRERVYNAWLVPLRLVHLDVALSCDGEVDSDLHDWLVECAVEVLNEEVFDGELTDELDRVRPLPADEWGFNFYWVRGDEPWGWLIEAGTPHLEPSIHGGHLIREGWLHTKVLWAETYPALVEKALAWCEATQAADLAQEPR